MKSLVTAIFISVAVAWNSPAFSAELRVPQDYLTLQLALDSAKLRDTIVMDSGTYSGVGFKDIVVTDARFITIKAKYDNHSSIIDATQRTFLKVTDSSYKDIPINVKGLTIRRADTAIWIGVGGNIVLSNCKIEMSEVGVADVSHGFNYVLIDSNRLVSCFVGIVLYGDSWATVTRNVLQQNGEAVVWLHPAEADLSNNVICKNLYGLEIDYLLHSIPISRNIIASNSIGISMFFPVTSEFGHFFVGNDVWDNDINFADIPPLTGINCNFSENPHFCDTSLASLCVSSLSGVLPQNNPCAVDVGFHEGVACYCGDVDVSGNVDIGDISAIISFLYLNGPAPNPPAAGEIDGISPIDIGDLTRLIDYLYISFLPLPCGT